MRPLSVRRAFTLIELLVVIAIIAILAAILFPVFAQAKAAAKKTAAISNQKQIGTGLVLYTTDTDDKYPMMDGCAMNSSLNPKYQGAAMNTGTMGCTTYNRINTYHWPKWVMPYVKNVDLFSHPGRQRDAAAWDTYGEVFNGFALNASITGSAGANTTTNQIQRIRNSWLGGTTTSIPSPSETMVLLEFGSSKINFAPMAMTQADYDATGAFPISQTVYPPAWREFWGRLLMKWTTCSGANMSEISNEADPRATFTDGIVVGRTDTSAKFMKATQFLAKTPTAAEYGPLGSFYQCGTTSEIMRPTTANVNIDYPMWGLTK